MTYLFSENTKTSWESDLSWLNEMAEGCLLEIEVASPSWGVQTYEQRAPFSGFTYDPEGDIFYVLTQPLHHSIKHPVEIMVDMKDGLLRYISVQNSQGEVETISLFQVPRLAPPTESPWPPLPPYRRPTDT